MLRAIFFAIAFLPFFCGAQPYTPSRIFAHNDYARSNPFHEAYSLGVGYIESDVFLKDNKLMVAHYEHEIAEGRTLEELYLKPLLAKIKANKGFAYPDTKAHLTLMIDLKTAGTPTLKAIVRELARYRPLTTCPTLQIMISGSVPPPDTWKDFPAYIYFDGRPGTGYTPEQLDRIAMISTGFRQHFQWDGRSPLEESERIKMLQMVYDAHWVTGKPFRFWATPDFPEAWKVLMELNMDVIVTDDVKGLAEAMGR
jgi:alkaline phosphatase